jgi:hypothetical protein
MVSIDDDIPSIRENRSFVHQYLPKNKLLGIRQNQPTLRMFRSKFHDILNMFHFKVKLCEKL